MPWVIPIAKRSRPRAEERSFYFSVGFTASSSSAFISAPLRSSFQFLPRNCRSFASVLCSFLQGDGIYNGVFEFFASPLSPVFIGGREISSMTWVSSRRVTMGIKVRIREYQIVGNETRGISTLLRD